MLEFIKSNSYALKAGFFITSAIFTIIIVGVLSYGYYIDEFPEWSLVAAIILSASIGMPFFIVIIGTLRGTWDTYKRQKAFSTLPFSELVNHGFSEDFKNKNSKWDFSEQVLIGSIDNYQILAEVDTQHAPDVIRFQALTEHEVLGKDEVTRLIRQLKIQDIQLDFQGVTKCISIKTERINTINDLLKELNTFILIIKYEKFEPLKNEYNML